MQAQIQKRHFGLLLMWTLSIFTMVARRGYLRDAGSHLSGVSQKNSQATNALALLSLILVSVIVGMPKAEAQTFKVLHIFTGPDGANPNAGLIRDTAGNLYGTSPFDGNFDTGTVFKLDASDNFTMLHSFGGGTDGAAPSAPLIEDADHNFYGTTFGGGGDGCLEDGAPLGCGTIFKIDTSGNETVLYRFKDGPKGARSAAPLFHGGQFVRYNRWS